MASSGSYARGDQPRSVPDKDARLHKEAAQQQRAYNDQQEAELERKRKAKLKGDRPTGLPDVGRPTAAESLIPIWGSGRTALAELHDGNYVGAAVNGALAVSDLVPAKAIGGALLKGGLKAAPTVWRTKPWEAAKGVVGKRQWLTEHGFAAAGQPVHHWAIHQGGRGKRVPDAIKNGLWNLKPTQGAVQHGRIHGPYTVNGQRLPQYNAAQRIWYGTPDWFKAANVSIPGHAGVATGIHMDEGVERPRR